MMTGSCMDPMMNAVNVAGTADTRATPGRRPSGRSGAAGGRRRRTVGGLAADVGDCTSSDGLGQPKTSTLTAGLVRRLIPLAVLLLAAASPGWRCTAGGCGWSPCWWRW